MRESVRSDTRPHFKTSDLPVGVSDMRACASPHIGIASARASVPNRPVCYSTITGGVLLSAGAGFPLKRCDKDVWYSQQPVARRSAR